MKAVILEGNAVNPGDLSWEPVKRICDPVIYEGTTETDKIERIGDADIVFINKLKMDETVFSKCPNIRYVGISATGYNVIDLEAARRHGVTVTNVPAYSTESVTQHTWALILEIMNRVAMHDQFVKEGGWSDSGSFTRWLQPIVELNGRTLGIYGFGHIGRRVAEIARAFGMEVLVCTKHPENYQEYANEHLRFAGQEEFWSAADILTLHCPLTKETEGLINAETINKMKDGAVLINVSRGQIVEELALASALRSGKIAAAGVDVVSEEPIKKENPLLDAPNVIITSHLAWSGVGARKRLVEIMAENLKCYLEGHPQNVIS